MDMQVETQANTYAEQYLKPLKSYLISEDVNEVVINPDGSIYVEFSNEHHMQPIDLQLEEKAIKQLGNSLAGETKNSLGKQNPIVSGKVNVWNAPLRVQVIVPPAVEKGISLSIRKYTARTLTTDDIKFVEGTQVNLEDRRKERHSTIKKLADEGKLDAVFKKAIDERFNIMISGGTSSGKTTVARALLAETDQEERIITIEDAIELLPTHGNHVCLVSDSKGTSERSPAKLLKSCLRMRPDRLILGEIRGTEALNFLEAINTGHPGSLTTIHADSPLLAFDRLALMVMQAGMPLSHKEIVEYAKRTIDLVIQVGRVGSKRGVLEVYLPSIEDSDK